MIEERERIIFDSHEQINIFKEYPFLRSIFSKAIFPVVNEGSTEYVTFSKIIEGPLMPLYKCTSRKYDEEIAMFQSIYTKKNAFFNPYNMPCVEDTKRRNESLELIEYLFKKQNKQLVKIDLRTLLLTSSKVSQADYSKILPSNVRFASFGKFKPLVVVYEAPVVSEKRPFLGKAYWGNILLWHQLIDKDRRETYTECFKNFYDSRHECIDIVSEPVVLVDSTDPFIEAVINKYEVLKPTDCQNLQRYLRYLSYLPLVVFNMESCLIFIEVLDNFEKILSESLHLQRPDEIFKRMKPNSSLYLRYLRECGMCFNQN